MNNPKSSSRLPGILFLLAIGICVVGLGVKFYLDWQIPPRPTPVLQRRVDPGTQDNISLDEARQLRETAEKLLNNQPKSDE